MPAPKLPPPPGGFLFPRIAKHLREKAGVPPGELARRLGISAPAVSQYENADKPMTEPTLRLYAHALEIPDFERAMMEALIAMRISAAVDAVPEVVQRARVAGQGPPLYTGVGQGGATS